MQNNSLKITVVTVCYNAVAVIEETIKSVINQTYDNIEYIVVDGGSTDGTVDVIKKYADSITLWVSEPDKGIYDAMNKAIRLSTGNYINFMNAGDTFANKSTLEEAFGNYKGNADVVYGDILELFPGHGVVLKRLNNLSGEGEPLGLCHQSTFIKGSTHKQHLYDTSFRICADRNAFYNMWKNGCTFEYVPVQVAYFEQLGGVSSTQLFQARRESLRMTGAKWYNSKGWWISLAKISVKKLIIIVLGAKRYDEIFFNSIASKYTKVS